MNSKNAKTYLAGLCLAALLTGGSYAAPGAAFSGGTGGCSTNGAAEDNNVNATPETPDDVERNDVEEEEDEGNAAREGNGA